MAAVDCEAAGAAGVLELGVLVPGAFGRADGLDDPVHRCVGDCAGAQIMVKCGHLGVFVEPERPALVPGADGPADLRLGLHDLVPGPDPVHLLIGCGHVGNPNELQVGLHVGGRREDRC